MKFLVLTCIFFGSAGNGTGTRSQKSVTYYLINVNFSLEGYEDFSDWISDIQGEEALSKLFISLKWCFAVSPSALVQTLKHRLPILHACMSNTLKE